MSARRLLGRIVKWKDPMAMSDNSQRGVWNTLRRELGRMASDRVYLLLMLVLPLATFVFFITMFQGGKPENLPVAVYDADHSSLSRQVTRMIDATSSIRITREVDDLAQGKALLQEKKVYGLVVFPAGMEKDVYRGTAPNVVAYYNNAFLIPGSLLQRDIKTVVGTVSAGIALSTSEKKGSTPNQAMAQIQPIRLDTHVLFNPYTSYFYYLVSCFLPVMLQIFIMTVTVYALGTELKDGTASDWLDSAGGNVIKGLFGKMLPYSLVFLLIAFLMVIGQFSYFGMPLRGSLGLILFGTLLFVVTYQAVSIFLVSVFPSLRMCLSIASSYGAMAFTFSGLTFPYSAMPLGAKLFGMLFPFSHFLKLFIDQAFRGAPLAVDLLTIAGLSAFLVLPWLALHKLKRVSYAPEYWHRI